MGVLEVQPLGQWRRCAKVRGPEIRAALEMARSAEFQALLAEEASQPRDPGIHEPLIQVNQGQHHLLIRPELLSCPLRERLSTIESLASTRFPGLLARFLPFSLADPCQSAG